MEIRLNTLPQRINFMEIHKISQNLRIMFPDVLNMDSKWKKFWKRM